MPAQYLHDVPSWLLLASPHCWLERDDKAGFEEFFVPQMQLFIRQVERAEAMFPPLDGGEPLSARMRESDVGTQGHPSRTEPRDSSPEVGDMVM